MGRGRAYFARLIAILWAFCWGERGWEEWGMDWVSRLEGRGV